MMALVLREGDYVPDGRGGFRSAEGGQEVLERVLWKLTVRRGSFPFLPELGSRLHLLGRASTRQREALAGQYVAEALEEEPVTVTAVTLEDLGGGAAAVTAELLYQGEPLPVRVAVKT